MESPSPSIPAWASSVVAFLLDGARPGDLLPGGIRLDAVSAGHDAIRLATSRDGASVDAWLRPRAVGGGAYRTTAHFLLGHEGSALDAAGLRLLDELHAAILRREADLPAALLATLGERPPTPGSALPIDWLAVRAGVKPAARSVLRGAGMEDLIASAERQGLHAIPVDAAVYLTDFATGGAAGCDTILYVGATPAAAGAAVDAERAMMAAVARGAPVSATLNAALGRALGYPQCCIDFFAPRCDLPNARLRFEALRRTGGSALALLNDLDPVRSLVSHFVCRYDCETSRRYARTVLDAMGESDPARAEELSRALEGLVILFREGGALQLAGARTVGADRYAYRSVIVHEDPAIPGRWRDVLGHADEVRIGRGLLSPFRNGEPLGALSFDVDGAEVRPFVSAS